MKLWMSGEIQSDIADAHREARREVQASVNRLLAERDYGPGLIKWALIPIIIAFEDATYGEVKQYDAKNKIAEFRLKIDHATFKAAMQIQKKRLLAQALLRSIELMNDLGIKDFNQKQLLEDFLALARQEGWPEARES